MTDDEIREAAIGTVDVVKGTATPDEIAAAVAELQSCNCNEMNDRSDGACA